MASLGSLVIELAANTAKLSGDLGRAVALAESASGKMSAAANAAAGAFGLIGKAFAGGLIIHEVRSLLEFGERLDLAAKKAGLTGEAMTQLAYVAKQSQIDIDALSLGLKKMEVAVSKARAEGIQFGDAFHALGITLKDLKGLSPDQVFELIAQRLSELKSESDRSRAAVEIFGRAGADLIPIMLKGAGGIQAMREEAVKLGLSFSSEQLDKLSKTSESVRKLTESFKALALTLLAGVGPGLTDFFDTLTRDFTEGSSAENKIRHTIDFLKEMKAEGEGFFATKWGTSLSRSGFFTKEEGEAELARLEKLLATMTAVKSAASPIAPGKPPGFSANDPFKDLTAVIVTAQKQVIGGIDKVYADLGDATKTTIEKQLAAWEAFNVDLEELQSDAAGKNKISGDEAAERRVAFLDTILEPIKVTARHGKEALTELSSFAATAAESMQASMEQFFFDPFQDGLKGMARGFVDALRHMVAEILAAQVIKAFFGSTGGLGTFLELSQALEVQEFPKVEGRGEPTLPRAEVSWWEEVGEPTANWFPFELLPTNV